MAQSRSIGATLFGLSVLFVLGVAITCVAFMVFIPGPERGMTFYTALSIVCAAELVLFVHFAHSKLALAGAPTASTATRLQVHALIFIWLIATIIIAAIAVDPAHADTFTADKAFVIYLILTFLFFAATYFLYTKDIEVEKVDRQVVEERRSIQLNVPDVEQVIRAVDDLGQEHADHALLADRVHKKVDSVRTELEAILVSERGLDAEDEEHDWNSQIEQQVTQLVSLSSGTLTTAADQVPEVLSRIASQSEAILSTLSRRERSLMS